LDEQSLATLCILGEKALYVQEIQLICLGRLRPLALSDVWQLPERFCLSTIQCEFVYNVDEPMFLLQAIVRLTWRPMILLLALEMLTELTDIFEVMVSGYLLRCFDASSGYPWYYGYCAALGLLVTRFICSQTIHISRHMEVEVKRAAHAIQLELFRLPLIRNGQRSFGHISVNSRRMEILEFYMSTAASTIANIMGFSAKFGALYYIVGWLAAIPMVSLIVILLAKWGFERLVGDSSQWKSNTDELDSNVSEVYHGIKAIKLFSWERIFTWNEHSCVPVLNRVSFGAAPGELVAVTGKTGSGKSSLLLSICGELAMIEGTGKVAGSIAYLEQMPWIMNDTMRANVLFGREYDAELFAKIIHACALTDDIARWPNADLAVIGECGINISGGQRARLALARTLYSCANIYVLDDPLSAVDAHVKRHILEHVLLDSGMLAGKVRIITTNSGHILPYAHQIVTLEDAYISDKVISRNIKGVFVKSIIHAPMSFFDSTTRQHVSSAYNNGAEALASDIPEFIMDEGSGIIDSILSVYRIGSSAPQLLLVVPLVALATRKRDSLVDTTKKMLRTINREADIGRSRTKDIVADGVQMIRLFGTGPHFVQQYADDEDEREQLRLVLTLVRQTTGLVHCASKVRGFSDNIDLYRQYISLEPEAPYVVEDCRPAPSWPEAGRIEFRDFTLRYREDLPPALDGINLTINPGEKIGIVGRTGAGKSTLVKSLFRLVHGTTSGKILVDGQDIGAMGIGDLRPRLGIIPQESAMFPGSFKRNLGPLQEHTIEDTWAALIKSGIAPKVSPPRAGTAKAKGEEYRDVEYEENKAEAECSGQQQLFSLCRVLMRMRHVIVLDEATADVDLETDRHMQQLIRSEFSDRTVLTIAHRLETIMSSDRIIVMDNGRIAEIGSPQELIDAGGHFAGLVKANDFGA
ncbi:ATP-binding cassette glutathione S-conjugate transporter ycf1, partial [Coemansia biformis]